MRKPIVLPGIVRVDEMTQTKCVYDLTHCSSNAYVQKRMHSGSKTSAASPGITHLCYGGGLEWRGLVWRPDTMRRYGCCWWRYGTLIWGLVQPGALPVMEPEWPVPFARLAPRGASTATDGPTRASELVIGCACCSVSCLYVCIYAAP